jgi:hypothetical protein
MQGFGQSQIVSRGARRSVAAVNITWSNAHRHRRVTQRSSGLARRYAGGRSSHRIGAGSGRESTIAFHFGREASSSYQASLQQCGADAEHCVRRRESCSGRKFAEQTLFECIDHSIGPVGCLLKPPGDVELSPRTAQPSVPGDSHLATVIGHTVAASFASGIAQRHLAGSCVRGASVSDDPRAPPPGLRWVYRSDPHGGQSPAPSDSRRTVVFAGGGVEGHEPQARHAEVGEVLQAIMRSPPEESAGASNRIR